MHSYARREPVLLFAGFILAGCGHFRKPPPTSAETINDYGYHPIDPLPVELKPDAGVTVTRQKILDLLPDETMRLAIGEVMASGSITFGPAKAGYQGKSYLVVLDYIKFDTKSFRVETEQKEVGGRPSIEIKSVLPPYAQVSPPSRTPPGASAAPPTTAQPPEPGLLVPTYVGVGLRLTANVTVNEGSVDLGNLVAIGAAAQAKRVTGTLVVQTLGISGPGISGLIPMPSEISESTIQNAILALGAIKARLYDDKTDIHPRVVGVYNNLGGEPTVINTFISSVLAQPPEIKIVK